MSIASIFRRPQPVAAPQVATRRVGINLIGGPEWIGGQIYVRNLVTCLSRLPDALRPRIVLQGAINDEAFVQDLLTLDGVERGSHSLGADCAAVSHRLTRGARRLAQICAGHERQAVADVAYPALGCSQTPRNEIYWIPDFQHVHLPELFSPAERARRSATFTHMSRRRAVVALSSETALGDYRALFAASVAQPMRLRFCSVLDSVIPGVDVHDPFDLPEKFIYVPNQFWVHKNHAQLFRALGRLKARGVEIAAVCTGATVDHRNRAHFDALRRLVEELGIGPQVRFLGLIERARQWQLFRRAIFVVQPSWFEGWSTVVEDARALGRPILLSDIPVHREQAPEPWFFPLDDDEAFAQALLDGWRRRQPGPDPTAEANAEKAGAPRQMRFAREFMQIVERAISLQTPP